MNFIKNMYSNTPSNTVKLARAYPILQGKEILQLDAIDSLINQLRENIDLPEEDFRNTYLSFFTNFSEYIQALPNLKFPSFTRQYGQLEVALNRACYISEFFAFKKIPIPKRPNYISSAKHQAIWQFALVSAALLVDCSTILGRFTIDFCNESDPLLGHWHNLEGSMVGADLTATHYKIRDVSASHDLDLSKNLNIMLAKIIVPDKILSWLQQDPPVFAEWLAFLRGAVTGSGELSKAVWHVIRKLAQDTGFLLPDIDNILEFLEEIFLFEEVPDNVKEELQEVIFEHKDALKCTTADNVEAFVVWIREGIDNKTISVNTSTSFIHMLEHGFLAVTPGLFQFFLKSFPYIQNWELAARYFASRGLTQFNSLSAGKFLKGSNLAQDKILFFQDPLLIFNKNNTPGVSEHLHDRQLGKEKIFPQDVAAHVAHRGLHKHE